MCHECDDEDMNDQFNSSYVDELQSQPEEVREEIIDMLGNYMHVVMDRAEEAGFLFELITQWDRRKVAVYEAAIIMEKNILDDDNN